MKTPLTEDCRELRLLQTKYFNLRSNAVVGNIRYAMDDLQREPLKGLVRNLEAQGKQVFAVDLDALYNLAWCEATNGIRKMLYDYVHAGNCKDYEQADRLNDKLLSEYNIDVCQLFQTNGGK